MRSDAFERNRPVAVVGDIRSQAVRPGRLLDFDLITAPHPLWTSAWRVGTYDKVAPPWQPEPGAIEMTTFTCARLTFSRRPAATGSSLTPPKHPDWKPGGGVHSKVRVGSSRPTCSAGFPFHRLSRGPQTTPDMRLRGVEHPTLQFDLGQGRRSRNPIFDTQRRMRRAGQARIVGVGGLPTSRSCRRKANGQEVAAIGVPTVPSRRRSEKVGSVSSGCRNGRAPSAPHRASFGAKFSATRLYYLCRASGNMSQF